MSELVPNSSETLVPVVVDFEGRRWPLFKTVQGEPLVKDLDLASWLGYVASHRIRALIERHTESLGRVLTTVVETSAVGGRPSQAFLLTQEQALFVGAKSETPRATELLRAMIAVFMKARGLVEVAAQPDAVGRLEEWVKMRRAQEVHGDALDILRSDSARLGSELAAQREYLEVLDQKVNRDMPTAAQRAELVRAIGAACECRVSERERLMLVHIAEQGPATSQGKIGAAAKVGYATASRAMHSLSARCIVEMTQRDPSMRHLYNYRVIAEGLEGHAENCEIEYKRGAAALAQMLEMTSGEAVHVVPPNIPHIPLPQFSEEAGRSARDLLTDFVGKVCFDNGLSYKDFYSQLYARLAIEGMECRHRTSKDRRVSKIDYCDAHGWCPRALEIAKTIDLKTVLRNATEQRAG